MRTRKPKEVYDLPARKIGETEKAWKLDVDGKNAHWFPKSQCEYDGKTLTAPGWLLEEKGLEALIDGKA